MFFSGSRVCAFMQKTYTLCFLEDSSYSTPPVAQEMRKGELPIFGKADARATIPLIRSDWKGQAGGSGGLQAVGQKMRRKCFSVCVIPMYQ